MTRKSGVPAAPLCCRKMDNRTELAKLKMNPSNSLLPPMSQGPQNKEMWTSSHPPDRYQP